MMESFCGNGTRSLTWGNNRLEGRDAFVHGLDGVAGMQSARRKMNALEKQAHFLVHGRQGRRNRVRIQFGIFKVK
jgi:hypothetical protein